MKSKKFLSILLSLVLLGLVFSVSACAEQKNESTAKKPVMAVKCTSRASNGRLLTACAYQSAGGQNQVPAVSWTPVEGANAYAIYMLDTSANNWCHWITKVGPAQTKIKQGEKLKSSRYKGPYPPSGQHRYKIIVYALKKAPASLPGNFDKKNSASAIENKLGRSNIITSASTIVPYAHGDQNV